MEQNQQLAPANNSWKTLAIIALVLGIVALLFSFIPCLGMYAIFPGIIGIVLAVVSMLQAKKINAPNGMAIAAIACAVLGSAVAAYQYYKLSTLATDPNLKKGIEDFKNALDTLKINADTTSHL